MANALVTVRDYLRLFFRRKWVVVLPTLGGLLMVPLLWLNVPPKYRATALVRRKDLAVLRSTPSALVSKGGFDLSVDALRVEILSWTNLQRVIHQTNLDPGLQTQKDWQDMYAELRDVIDIRSRARDRGIDLIEISVIHRNPELAASVANAVGDNYVEETQKTSRADTKTAVEFLNDGTQEYQKKLRDTEKMLDEYKKEHFTDLPSVRDGILAKLFALRTDEITQEIELTKAESRLQESERQLTEVPETVKGTVSSKENPIVANMEMQLMQRKAALTAYLAKGWTDEHPQVTQVRREIAGLEKMISETPARIQAIESEIINPEYQELHMGKRRLEQDIEAHKAALLQIRSRIEANEQQLKGIVEEEKRYNDLMRDKNEAEQLYEQYRRSLVSARTRLEVESGQYGTQAEMVARALVPTSPYRPERVKIALASLAGGLCIGIALMFGLEFTDRSFRDMEDAASYLDVPVLGSIPTILSTQAIARGRRTRFWILGSVLLLLLVVVGGLFLLAPVTAKGLLTQVESSLSAMTDKIKEIL